MTTRETLTWTHAGLAGLSILAFGIIGLLISGAFVSFFEFGWLLVYVLWPFFLLNLIVTLVFQGLYEYVAYLFRAPPPPPDAALEKQPAMPWLREQSMWIGLFLGVSLTAVLEIAR